MKISDKIASEPFRLFFPLGVLASLAGIGYWPLSVFLPGSTPLSTKFHIWMQVHGFLLAFILGFLATAVPRLGATDLFRKSEVAWPCFLMSLSGTFAISAGFPSVCSP